jgi:hypothetical protein
MEADFACDESDAILPSLLNELLIIFLSYILLVTVIIICNYSFNYEDNLNGILSLQLQKSIQGHFCHLLAFLRKTGKNVADVHMTTNQTDDEIPWEKDRREVHTFC